METIRAGQDLLLTLFGRLNLTGGSAKMQYYKPGSRVVGEIGAALLDELSAQSQALFTPAATDTPGIMRIWLELTAADGRVTYGDVYRLRVRPVGA